MIGSLVVLLPSDHKGGSIQVQHHDEMVSFRGSREKLTFIPAPFPQHVDTARPFHHTLTAQGGLNTGATRTR